MVSILFACCKKRLKKTLGDFCNLKHVLKYLLHAQFYNKVLGGINNTDSPSCLEMKGTRKIV